jgi:ribonuclease P protein component
MKFIKRTKDFHDIFNNKKRINGNLFSVYYKKLPPNQNLSVGIIAGKKVGNAVKRNKFKRRIRAYFRENKSLWNYPLGIIVVAKKEATLSDWNSLKNQLDNIIGKILTNENF